MKVITGSYTVLVEHGCICHISVVVSGQRHFSSREEKETFTVINVIVDIINPSSCFQDFIGV